MADVAMGMLIPVCIRLTNTSRAIKDIELLDSIDESDGEILQCWTWVSDGPDMADASNSDLVDTGGPCVGTEVSDT